MTPRACTVFGISVAFGLELQVVGSYRSRYACMGEYYFWHFGYYALRHYGHYLEQCFAPENKEMPDEKNLRPLAYNDMEDAEVR